MDEFSTTTSIISNQSSGASARGDMSIAGDFECLPAMKTAAHGTVAEGSLAAATLAAADAASAAPEQPVAVSTHSAAGAARDVSARRCSDSAEGDLRQRKSSPGPAYFSNAYYKQLLLSFSSAKWFCPPPELSPFLLARNGFRCADTGTIECAVCGEKWTAQRGPHSEIMRTLAHTGGVSAAESAAALSPPPPLTLSTPRVYSLDVAAAKAGAREPGRRAMGLEEGTGCETQTAAVHITPLPAALSAAIAGAAGAAAATVGEDAETEARRDFEEQEDQHRREEEIEELAMGRYVIEGAPQQQKQTTGITGTAGAPPHDSREERKRTTQLLQEWKEVGKDGRTDQKTGLMDAVTLSFLHSECCPWRNSFIPLATIHLEGAAVQPAALISHWTNRVQQLRKAGVSPSQSAHPPRLALQSARAFLLSVLVAAAEATAATHAKTTTPSRGAAAEGHVAAEYIASKGTPVPHALKASECEKGVSSMQTSKPSGAVAESEAADTLKETSCCNGESSIAQFLSSTHSPLQAPCVSKMSQREVQLLRQLWLFLARADKEREILVNKYIRYGTVIPPVSASTLLLERKCELREGSQAYKEADKFLSLPILETLLQHVVSLLFDTRVPLPGSLGRSSLLARKNISDDEVPSSFFVFPKKHELVHIDCDKLFSFFGWEPVTDCMTCECQHYTAAAVPDEHQQQPQADAASGESNVSYAAPQQPVRYEIQQLDATQHAEVFSKHKESQGNQQQQVQVTRPSKVRDTLWDKKRKPAAVSAAEMAVEGRKSVTVLQCPYCFRRVELQKYVLSEEESCIISDSTWNLSFSGKAASSQSGDEAGVAWLSVEGRQQPVQERGDYGAQTAEGRKKLNSVGTRGEQNASNKDSKEERQENTGREMEEMCFSKNIERDTGRTTAVIYGDGGVDQTCSSARGYRSISRNADAEVRVRRNGDGKPPKEDTSVGRVCVSPQHPQVDHISSIGGSKSEREKELGTTTTTALTLSFDPVCAHRLHCPFVSNAIYKEKSPVVLQLFLSLFPVLVETLQLQIKKRRLDAEISELWGLRKRLQHSKQKSDDEKELKPDM